MQLTLYVNQQLVYNYKKTSPHGLCQNITITFCLGFLPSVIHNCIIFCSFVSPINNINITNIIDTENQNAYLPVVDSPRKNRDKTF